MKLMQGDCLERMKEIESGSVDLVVTSPPYNNWRNRRTQERKKDYWNRTNINYNSYDDKLSDDDYFKWQVVFLNECARVLKDTGTIVYNHKDAIFNYKVTSPITWILESECVYRQRVTWDRGGMQAFNPVRFYRVEEDIYILGKKAKGFKWNKDFAKYLSIWKINPSSKEHHPASFPLEIPERCIKSFTESGDIVLDPFMGSGTTGVACANLNRDFIGIEMDEDYFNIAQTRIEEAVKSNSQLYGFVPSNAEHHARPVAKRKDVA